MDSTKKWQRPRLYDFAHMGNYADWLCEHSEDIPEAGKVLIFRVHAEDYLWLKVGTGVHKISDLSPII